MNPACIQLDFSYLYIFPEFGQETMVTSPVYATVIHVFALHVCLPPERVEINQNNPGMFNKRDFNRSVYYMNACLGYQVSLQGFCRGVGHCTW